MKDNSIYNFVNHVLKSFFYYGFSGMLVKVLVPINVLFVISSLTLYQYGVYKLTFSLFIVFNGLLLSGLNGLVLNDSSNYFGTGRLKEGKRLIFEFFVIRILLSVIATFLFYFGASVLESHYSPGIAGYLKIISLLFITDAIITIIDIIFKSRLDFFGSSLVSIMPEILKSVLLIYVNFFTSDGLNISVLFWVILLSNVFSVFVLLGYFIFKFGLSFNIPDSGEYMIFKIFKNHGKWAIAKNYISSFVESIRLWVIRIFLSTESVALYSVAMSMVTTIRKFIPTQSISSLIPRYMSDIDTLRKVYRRFTKYSIWIFFIVSVVSFITVPFIVTNFMQKYVSSIFYFKILLFSIIVNSMILNKQVVYSSHKQKFLLVLSFIEMTFVFVFGIIFVKIFGLIGTIFEILLTEIIIAVIIYKYLIKIRPELKFPFRSLFTFNSEDRYWLKYLSGIFLSRIRKNK